MKMCMYVYLSGHGSDLAGRNLPTNHVLPEARILQVSEVRDPAAYPTLVLVASVTKLSEDP